MASPSNPLPQTMKSWTVARNGPPATALSLQPDRPVPAAPPSGANILVKVLRVTLNPADLHFMQSIPTWLPFRREATPGLDFAGEVVAAGPAAKLPVGTKVGGSLGVGQVLFGTGSLAEYIVVPADLVAAKPDEDAAWFGVGAAAGLLGVAGQTAALVMNEAGVKEGNHVLVNGASGGVGSILVQVAKSYGAVVTGVCSGANEAMVKGLGVDEVIDYKAHDPLEPFLEEKFKDAHIDFIFDCVGSQALFSNATKYLDRNGKFINIVGGRTQGIVPFIRNKLLPTFLGGTPRYYRMMGLSPSGAFANQVAQWVKDKRVKEVPVDSEWAMEDVPKAYEKLATKRAKGKIVIKVQD